MDVGDTSDKTGEGAVDGLFDIIVWVEVSDIELSGMELETRTETGKKGVENRSGSGHWQGCAVRMGTIYRGVDWRDFSLLCPG